MDIVIVSQYLRNIEKLEGNNSRFVYLANMLSENSENEVEIITSNYMHGPKRHAKSVQQPENFKIIALEEPGYSKNVCLKRFYSHAILAKNLKNYLQNRKKPDVIYCAIPSLDVAKEVADYCKKYNVRFIVDIQDLWPEAFKMVFHVPVLSDIIFAPMKIEADKIYKHADEIIAVSQTYVDRAIKVSGKCKKGIPVFLGTKLSDFDRYAITDKIIENEKEFKIAYCGSLTSSYDLTSIIDAINILNKEGYNNINFIVMGDGELKESFENYAKKKNVKCDFKGSLLYPQMVNYLSSCDIAVNPIKKGSAGSVLNKVGDYAMAGKPVVNTQECIEYRQLLNNFKAGFNCDTIIEISNAIKIFLDNPTILEQMSIGSRRLGEQKFNRTDTYKLIVNKILYENGE